MLGAPQEPHHSGEADTVSASAILVVTEGGSDGEDYRCLLTAVGHTVEVATRDEQVVAHVEPGRFGLALVEVECLRVDGLALLRGLRQADPDLVCILLAAVATVEEAVEAVRGGAFDVVVGRVSQRDLLLKVGRGLEEHRRLAEARRLKRESERLEAVKARLVSTVAHEIRAPLSAIRAYLEQLRVGGTCDVERHSRVLAASVERIDSLLLLVDDLLDLSRIQSGGLAREVGRVDVGAMLHAIACLQAAEAATRGISVECDLPPEPLFVEADKEDLVRLFANLIGNAVKYNRTGGRVWVKMAAEPMGVRVEVRDTGVGIAAEHLPHLFDDFYRVVSPETQGVEGSGLGLAVVRRIADAYGIGIDVQSRPGEGTTFTARLPREYRRR
mgnify:CR=1 FL=1